MGHNFEFILFTYDLEKNMPFFYFGQEEKFTTRLCMLFQALLSTIPPVPPVPSPFISSRALFATMIVQI